MEKLKYFFITFILFLLSGLSRILPNNLRVKFAIIFSNFIFIFFKKRNEISIKNLDVAFPLKSKIEKKEIAKKSFNNLAITLFELLSLTKFNDNNIREIVEIENYNLYLEAKNKGQGIIFLSSHYGNWELMAYAAGILLNEKLLIIVQPQKNYFADRVLNSIRSYQGNRLVSKYIAAREIVKEMSNNGVLAILADQSASSDMDVYVNFFGIQTAFYKSPAELALRFNSPVILGQMIRKNDNTYKLILSELDHSDLEYNKQGIIEFTQRYALFLEKICIEHPELWAWQHKKWKHSFTELY